jgi:hypothetical protein
MASVAIKIMFLKSPTFATVTVVSGREPLIKTSYLFDKFSVMNIHLYRYLQHSPRWPLVEGRPAAPQGAEPGRRAGGTP